MTTTPPLLDTRRAVETPEGITLDLRVAGPLPRALAWTLDSLLRYALLLILAIVLGYLGQTGVGLWLILLFLTEWFYPVLFELYRNGATPGKAALGLQVCHDNGTPVGATASLLRNLLRAADFLPVCYGFGLVCMLLHPEFKRLGDLAAGTVVIYRDLPPNPPPLPAGPSRQPLFPLSAAEQQLLIHFAERSATLHPDRQAELAALLIPLHGNSGDPVPPLLANARWLAGGQS